MMRNPTQTIGNLIDKQSVCTIASLDDEGYPNLKAMGAPRRREGIRELWFSTNTPSLRVEQYLKNPKASVYFVDRRFFRGVMLIGTMEVLQDEESKQMIWQEGDERFYPGGVSDPDYCVLKFTAIRGRYVASFKSEDFDIGDA